MTNNNNKILNPTTGRWINTNGVTARKLRNGNSSTMQSIHSPVPSADVPWPWDAIDSRLHKFSGKNSRSLPRFAVLLTTGAMNPAHAGHIDMFRRAKKYLENDKGFYVLGGWLSPSHDNYVIPKAKKSGTSVESAKNRALLASKLINSTSDVKDWLRVGTWESLQLLKGTYPEFYDVVKKLKRDLAKHLKDKFPPGLDVSIFYIAGGDRVGFAQYLENMGLCGTVIIPRDGFNNHSDEFRYCVHEENPNVYDYSSTKVRDAISKENWDYVSNALSDEVLEDIRKNGLYGAEKQ